MQEKISFQHAADGRTLLFTFLLPRRIAVKPGGYMLAGVYVQLSEHVAHMYPGVQYEPFWQMNDSVG